MTKIPGSGINLCCWRVDDQGALSVQIHARLVNAFGKKLDNLKCAVALLYALV